MSLRRCAIYTRKSTDEGLDQEFNSLHAQREACAAYILSQRHEGWRESPALYDDGGFSGGSMERPALTRLLADIKAGQIDVVVVYKVDRLTRALTDFAKIVEIFDAADVSFVSVTQAFNTTTSMGRLTLNVLLSFAQFEREVGAERIRDKIAASKRKGMWMGGVPPLGYDVRDKTLVVNPAEAETVLEIFRRYLEFRSVRALKASLDRDGIVSKRRISRAGRVSGGVRFTRGALHALLGNPLYIGEIAHRGERHSGRHDAILDRDLWHRVQTALSTANGGGPKHRSVSQAERPLDGLLFDSLGRPMKPTSASRVVAGGRKTYHYYASRREPGDRRPASRVPADQLEELIRSTLVEQLGAAQWVATTIRQLGAPPDRVGDALEAASRHASAVQDRLTGNALADLVRKIDLGERHVTISIDTGALVEQPDLPPLRIERDFEMHQPGRARPIVLGMTADTPERDSDLIALVADARRWAHALQSGEVSSVQAITEREGLAKGTVSRVLPLAHLAPDISAAILDGRQPSSLTARRLRALPDLPLDWIEQRRLLGFAAL